MAETKSKQNIARGKNHVCHHPIRPGAVDLSFLTTDNKVSAFPHREPEQRLWKLFSQTVSPFAMIELFVFMLFLVITVIGIISCFAELSSLLQTGAINHLTTEALNGGRVIRIAAQM